jgi:hypothetical protein
MANLIRYQCGATLFPINPTRKGVLGIETYPSLEAVPLPVDLAIVATPAPAVPVLRGEPTHGTIYRTPEPHFTVPPDLGTSEPEVEERR